MRALLISSGSLGDTLPFLALGKGLAERGHEVTMMINGYYKALFEKEGLDYVELSTAEEHAKIIEQMGLWKRSHTFENWREYAAFTIAKVYACIAERYIPGETIAASQAPFFGARVAQEKLGIPLATIHLQPLFFRSIYDTTGVTSYLPLWLGHGFDRLIDFGIDRWLGPPVNDFRAKLGLPPASFILKHWWNSPQLVLGFFPDWFNPPQPDWPANSRLVGFPFWHAREGDADLTDVEAFLAAGDPPLVFSVSSFTTDAQEYFAQSIEAARLVGRRAVFLTPFQDQIPKPLPPEVRAYPFIPLDKLLPRAALHVHHAGSGTVAHTLAAGIPHLTVPQGMDQVDISRRVERLGVSAIVWPKKYRAREVADKIGRLLASPEVAQRCREYAAKSRAMRAIEATCLALEQLHEATRHEASLAQR